MQRQAFWKIAIICIFASSIVGLFTSTRLPVQAGILQGCGVITTPDSIDYPLDRAEFQLVNPFGRPNGRYSGQLHSGDDWIKTDGASLGEPVYAIAPGRVTYSNPTGWGSDKGVVIIEHTLVDGLVFYSLYGHIEESDTIKFPARASCVEKGTVVGVIGDPRPAPHLHFEIRTFGPADPGPGYWEVDPTLNGWLNPRQFIDNQKIWLSPIHRWHIFPGDETGLFPSPLLYADGSMTLISHKMLETYDKNGRLLNQHRLADSVNPVSLTALDDNRLLVGIADGRIQYFSRSAGYLEQWVTESGNIAWGPVLFGDLLLLHDGEERLHIFTTSREVVQIIEGVAKIRAYAVTPQIAALLTDNWQLFLIGSDGRLLDQMQTLPNSDVVASPDGGVFLRNQGELRWISRNGVQYTILDGLSANRSDSAMLFDSYHQQLILWGIQRPYRLTAVSLRGQILWQTDLYQVDLNSFSRSTLLQPDRCTLVLASQRGPVVTFDARNGAMTGQIRLWGQYHTNVWLGAAPQENVLRIQVAGQLIGLDLPLLSGQTCLS